MNQPTSFETEFLSWSESRQRRFITLLFLSKKDQTETLQQLLQLIHHGTESVMHTFCTALFAKFSHYKSTIFTYLETIENNATIRLLLMSHLCLDHMITWEVIDYLISLYMNPKDTMMEPIIETFVTTHTTLTLPSIIKTFLEPKTALRSRQLLSLIGKDTILAELKKTPQIPQHLINAIHTL